MKISVCMATYNGEKYLKQQLNSILAQLSTTDEVIISDNISTDTTVKIIESYQDHRIKLFHCHKKNLISNFENALKNASGDVIFLSDQDDVWVSNKVEKYKLALKDNVLVFSNASMFQDEDMASSKLFFSASGKKTGILNNLFKVNFLGCTLAFQKSILETALPFPQRIPMHDIWLGLVAETIGKTMYLDEPLVFYRRHDDVVSATGGKSTFSLYKKIKIRYNLLISLILRLLKLG